MPTAIRGHRPAAGDPKATHGRLLDDAVASPNLARPSIQAANREAEEATGRFSGPFRCPPPGPQRPEIEVLQAWMLGLQEDVHFYRTLQHVYAKAAASQDWGWHALYENPYVRCGLLWLGPGASLPLHDHGDMLSLMLGLVGELEVERYDAPPQPGSEDGHVLLHGGVRSTLRRGGISIVDGPKGNIHGFVNASLAPVVVLDALWHGGQRVQRHLFFPTSSHPAESLSAIRLCECRVHELGAELPDHPHG